jgi:hypothetical protein
LKIRLIEVRLIEVQLYIDVCSLYPTVQCYDDYPVGHPTKIFKPPMYNSNWYGLIKCAILPPRGLYHPVLPVKNKTKSGDEKLTFPLCQLCAKLNNQKDKLYSYGISKNYQRNLVYQRSK